MKLKWRISKGQIILFSPAERGVADDGTAVAAAVTVTATVAAAAPAAAAFAAQLL